MDWLTIYIVYSNEWHIQQCDCQLYCFSIILFIIQCIRSLHSKKKSKNCKHLLVHCICCWAIGRVVDELSNRCRCSAITLEFRNTILVIWAFIIKECGRLKDICQSCWTRKHSKGKKRQISFRMLRAFPHQQCSRCRTNQLMVHRPPKRICSIR